MATKANDEINIKGQTFNGPGELFNSDAESGVVRRYLQRLPDEGGTSQYEASNRPTVRTTLTSLSGKVTDTAPEAPLHRRMLVGSFTAVRAAKVVHQHDRGVWDQGALPKLLGSNDEADPSDAEVQQQYADLQLFTYLPAAIAPTQADFEDMIRPSRRAAYLASRLPFLGIVIDPRTENEDPAIEAGQEEQVLLTPFEQTLRRGCEERLERLLGVNNG